MAKVSFLVSRLRPDLRCSACPRSNAKDQWRAEARRIEKTPPLPYSISSYYTAKCCSKAESCLLRDLNVQLGAVSIFVEEDMVHPKPLTCLKPLKPCLSVNLLIRPVSPLHDFRNKAYGHAAIVFRSYPPRLCEYY